MHINAQIKVDRMTMWLKKQRGHDQHAAITISITNSITTLFRCGTWACVGLDVGFPGAGWIVKTRGFVNQNVWAIKKTHREARKHKETQGNARKHKEAQGNTRKRELM